MGEQFSTEHIDKAIEKLNEEPKQSIADDLKAYFTQMLQNADFVQVVRCSDCKHFFEFPKGATGHSFCKKHSTIHKLFQKDENWFCADGERRENNA